MSSDKTIIEKSLKKGFKRKQREVHTNEGLVEPLPDHKTETSKSELAC